jgi:TonB family protein
MAAIWCLPLQGTPAETNMEYAYLNVGFSVTIRSYPVSHSTGMFPAPRTQRMPDYPMDMRRRAMAGDVRVRTEIDAGGSFRVVEVVSSSQKEFRDAVLEALKSWTFDPAQHNGHPVAVLMEYQFDFNSLIDN